MARPEEYITHLKCLINCCEHPYSVDTGAPHSFALVWMLVPTQAFLCYWTSTPSKRHFLLHDQPNVISSATSMITQPRGTRTATNLRGRVVSRESRLTWEEAVRYDCCTAPTSKYISLRQTQKRKVLRVTHLAEMLDMLGNDLIWLDTFSDTRWV